MGSGIHASRLARKARYTEPAYLQVSYKDRLASPSRKARSLYIILQHRLLRAHGMYHIQHPLPPTSVTNAVSALQISCNHDADCNTLKVTHQSPCPNSHEKDPHSKIIELLCILRRHAALPHPHLVKLTPATPPASAQFHLCLSMTMGRFEGTCAANRQGGLHVVCGTLPRTG